MTNSVTLTTAPSSFLAATNWRRELRADMREIEDIFAAAPDLHDVRTEILRKWKNDFFTFYRENPNDANIENQFIAELQNALVDALPFLTNEGAVVWAPLDEEAVLGNDGQTYGKKRLSLHLHSTPEPYRYRSPLSLQDPTLFMTQPHPIVQGLVKLLQRKNAMPQSVEIQQAYQQLQNQNQLPTIPTQRTERIRLLREEYIQREAETVQETELFARHLSVMQAALAQRIQQEFAPVHERANAAAQRQLGQMDTLEQRGQTRLQVLEKEIERLEKNNAARRTETQQLKQEINKTRQDTITVNQKDARLSVTLNETRQAIEDLKKSQANSFLKGLAIAGLCLVAGVIGGQIAAATGGAFGASGGVVGGGGISGLGARVVIPLPL